MEDIQQQLSCNTLPFPSNLPHAARPGRFGPRSLVPQPEEASSSKRDNSPLHGENRPHGDNTHSTTAATSIASGLFNRPPPRQLCVRHKGMGGEGVNLKLQKFLDALPVSERETVSTLWSMFSSLTHAHREIILQGLLTICCSSQLSLLNEQVPQLLCIDPFLAFPREVSLQVLKYLDATSLTRAARVSKLWKSIAYDDILWRNMCEQQTCKRCGWGLPLLERKRLKSWKIQASSSPSPGFEKCQSCGGDGPASDGSPSTKRCKLSESPDLAPQSSPAACISAIQDTPKRPWKEVYSEREKVWRHFAWTLKGHTNGVMCLQYSETLNHPNFPILMTGSFDRTVRIWDVETGREIGCLRGHQRAIRALQFDEVKLITGSMDKTLKIWNWRTGECIRTLEGHGEGVTCLTFDNDVLVSGSVNATVRIWDFRTEGSHTFHGHRDWINAVVLWDGKSAPTPGDQCDVPDIDSKKLLFSASDDRTIRLWDLSTGECIREFTGHMAQVQCIKLAYVDDDGGSESGSISSLHLGPPVTRPVTHWEERAAAHLNEGGSASPTSTTVGEHISPRKRGPYAVLMSGSLDNTMKMWDIESATCLKTYFGHTEGLWAVDVDRRHLVSASHDRTIKIWDRKEALCKHTLVGHQAAVTCLKLTDDKIFSGSDDGDIRIWCFAPEAEGS
ncbi:WD40-repeat-containing domain protein [Cantharellus anzutake]|uniref:WD40-repeat-containing domain protein n=1 Tax=Cantharellus anzutake TaxID=1750568 RepID=UPI001905DBCD|nr:WD40-repeat-containing domain protein [Cantharellus anzutake]KAF8317500.1 WD40-repeat-containing domain protein [Cantharellus anzutake]